MSEETDAREPMLPVEPDEVQTTDMWETEEVRERLEGGQVVERITKRTRPLSSSRNRPLSRPVDDGPTFEPRAPVTGSAFLNHSGFSEPMEFHLTEPADPGYPDDTPDTPDAPDSHESNGSYWQEASLHTRVPPLPAAQGLLRDAETLDEALTALRGRTPRDIALTVAQRVRRYPLYLVIAACLVLVLCVGMSTLLMLNGTIATPSVLASATATSGEGGSGCCSGGTIRPTNTTAQKAHSTPTLLPTTPPGAPTATLIPYASSATVSFKAATQTLAGDGTMTSCVSGCTLPAKTASGSTSGSASRSTTGWTQTSLGGTVAVQLIPDGDPAWSSNLGASFSVCVASYCCPVAGAWSSGTIKYFSCSWSPGWTSSVPSGAWKGSGSAGQYCSDNSGSKPCTYSWWNSSPFSSAGYASVSYNDCHAALNDAETTAQRAASGAISAALSGWSVIGTSISADPNAWTCSPAIGQAGTSVTGGAKANYSAIGYHPSDALAVASQRITALLPSDDYWSSGPSTCTPSASANGTSSIQVTCSDTGTATFDWRSTSPLGQSHASNLLTQLTGQTVTSATSTCNDTTGVVASSCTIATSGGSAWMPTNAGVISISVS